MFRNYIKSAIRNLWRNKVYAFVSIFGLALGISCALLITLYIKSELSYENFQENKDRIYRVSQEMDMGGRLEAAVSNIAAGPTLTAEYPEIENYVRFLGAGQTATVRIDDRVFKEEGYLLTDSTFFDILTFDLITGNPEKVLREPNTIVLTESLAAKYFGNQEALGKQMKVNNSVVTVDGIVADPPANTEFSFQALRPITAIPPQARAALEYDWYRLVCYTYILVTPQFEKSEFEDKLTGFYEKYIIPFQQANGVGGKYAYHLDALDGLHFDNSKEYDLPRGNKNYIYIFGAVALFILVIACINFINLSLAQSGRRGKEVGVRKTLGADVSAVRTQFLGEAFLIALIALIVGVALVELLLPVFNTTTGKELNLPDLFTGWNILLLLSVYAAVAILSGFYPAFVLSSLDAVRVLKGKVPNMGGHYRLRKTLVVVQFVFSLAMITCTAVVLQQFTYMKGKDLGFDKDQVALVNIPADTSLVNHSETFRNEVAKIPGVKKVSNSGTFPGSNVGELLFRIEQNGSLTEKGIKFMFVDEHFLELYGIDLIAGRNFGRERPTDATSAFIINQTAAKQFGWTDNPLGKRMQWGLEANNTATNDGEVIGVVRDFNFSSLHNPIEPFVFIFNPQQTALVSFKIASGETEKVLSDLKLLWTQFAGVYPLNYEFVDDKFDALYENESRMLTLFGYFSGLSIIIALLGLFALSSFTIEQRVKEIGIRKILGADNRHIIGLLSRDFLILVIVAALIAMPLSYHFMSDWLRGFAYRINISFIMMFLVLIAALLISLGVIAYHSIRAARKNPVNSLRFE